MRVHLHFLLPLKTDTEPKAASFAPSGTQYAWSPWPQICMSQETRGSHHVPFFPKYARQYGPSVILRRLQFVSRTLIRRPLLGVLAAILWAAHDSPLLASV